MAHLAVVSLEVANVLEGVGGEDLDEVGVGCGKHVATIAEGTLQEGVRVGQPLVSCPC